MGKTGFTMTLLSTLAALVIIVHTAEEEYERAQRGIRARSFDVGTPAYEQSQPCHWRNMKSVRRRSADVSANVAPRLSENISLFQSLRVLQEGEEDEELSKAVVEGQTCMKTSALSAMIVSCGLLIAALLAALLVAARGWRRSEHRTPLHAYVPHKGRIK